MPDENSTQVWINQTTQNDNAVQNKADNDFVLDFWDWEEIGTVNTPEEKSIQDSQDEWNVEESSSDTNTETNMDFSDEDIFESDENWEKSSESINEQWTEEMVKEEVKDTEDTTQEVEQTPEDTDKTDNWNESDDDFVLSFDNDISFDNTEETDDAATDTTNLETEKVSTETDSSHEEVQEKVEANDDLLIPDETPITTEDVADKEENVNEMWISEEKQDNQMTEENTFTLDDETTDSKLQDNEPQENEKMQSLEWEETTDTNIFLSDDESADSIAWSEDNSIQNNTDLFKDENTETLANETDTWDIDLAQWDSQNINWDAVNEELNPEIVSQDDNQFNMDNNVDNSDIVDNSDATTNLNENLEQGDSVSQIFTDNQPVESNSNMNEQSQAVENNVESNTIPDMFRNDEDLAKISNIAQNVEENIATDNAEVQNNPEPAANSWIDFNIPTVSNETPIETTSNNITDSQPSNPSEWSEELSNNPNQTEISSNITEEEQQTWEAWEIKSTLSLDQILDSELMSNPQFADTSKSSPKNEPQKQSWGHSKLTGVIACILLFLLAWFVVTLAFPSLGINRHFLDNWEKETVIINENESEDTTIDTEEDDLPEIEDQESEDDRIESWSSEEEEYDSHGTTSSIEIIEDTEDDFEDENDEWREDEQEEDESDKPTPYTFVEDEDIAERQSNTAISADIINAKISAFKWQGDNYYAIGVEDANKKIMKYALYIQYLCEEYQSKIENGEWLDESSLNSFESEVNTFLAKIDKELGWDDEVETIYSHDNSDDEDKGSWREYLTTR